LRSVTPSTPCHGSWHSADCGLPDCGLTLKFASVIGWPIAVAILRLGDSLLVVSERNGAGGWQKVLQLMRRVRARHRAAQRTLKEYLTELRAIHATGAGVPEESYYPALSSLFDAVGKTLRPKVRGIINIKNRGPGIPDGGLFTAEQFHRQSDDAPKAGQLPARGAIEAKGTKPDVKTIVASQQVKEHLSTYGIVIVTNLRSFAIVDRGANGQPVERESFALRSMNRTSGNTRPRIRAPPPNHWASRSSSSSRAPAFTRRR
jgi:hypothetical protein